MDGEQQLLMGVALVAIGIVLFAHHFRWDTWSEKETQAALVVITGAGGGIGSELAEQACQRGASAVVLLDHKYDAIEASGYRLQGLYPGVKVKWALCDVADEARVVEACRRVAEAVPDDTPIVWICCAGVVSGRRADALSAKDIRDSYEVNALQFHHTVRGLLPFVCADHRRARSSIVVFGSVMSHLHAARLADYAGSKAAVRAAADCVRDELQADACSFACQRARHASQDVGCGCFCPCRPTSDGNGDEGRGGAARRLSFTRQRATVAERNAHKVAIACVFPDIVGTGMFEGAYSMHRPWLRDWLFPELSPESVAKATLDAVESGAADTFVPWHAGLVVAATALLPRFIADLATGYMGGWWGMLGFRGRRDRSVSFATLTSQLDSTAPPSIPPSRPQRVFYDDGRDALVANHAEVDGEEQAQRHSDGGGAHEDLDDLRFRGRTGGRSRRQSAVGVKDRSRRQSVGRARSRSAVRRR